MSRRNGARRALVVVFVLLEVIGCFSVLENGFLNKFMLLVCWERKEVQSREGKEGRSRRCGKKEKKEAITVEVFSFLLLSLDVSWRAYIAPKTGRVHQEKKTQRRKMLPKNERN